MRFAEVGNDALDERAQIVVERDIELAVVELRGVEDRVDELVHATELTDDALQAVLRRLYRIAGAKAGASRAPSR